MMYSYCPVCFAPVTQPECPHCGANVQLLHRARLLEQTVDAADPFPALQDALQIYLQLDHLPAVARLLSDLADHCLHGGRWRMAQFYLQQILAIGDAAGEVGVLLRAKRQLAILLAQQGDTIIARHLLEEGYAEDDQQAALELVRLAVLENNPEMAFRWAGVMNLPYDYSLRVAAWLCDLLARSGDPSARAQVHTVMDAAEEVNDSVSQAIALRALGLIQMRDGEILDGRRNMLEAIRLFHTLRDPYEQAQTQVVFADAYATQNEYLLAVKQLESAVVAFRRLGARSADQAAQAKLAALRELAPPDMSLDAGGDSTAQLCFLWIPLQEASPESVQPLIDKIVWQHGGWHSNVSGGILAIFGMLEALDRKEIVVEAALALYSLIERKVLSVAGQIRILGAVISLPASPDQVLLNPRTVLAYAPFKQMQAEIQAMPPGAVYIDQVLLNAVNQHHYQIEAVPNSAWGRIRPPDFTEHTRPLTRTGLLDYAPLMQDVDQIVQQFHRDRIGGLIALDGAIGSGKTRLLNFYMNEIKHTTHTWTIHIAGDEASRVMPFGAIQNWLGGGLQLAGDEPLERRLSLIAAFRESIRALLVSHPVLLVIDNAHLLDSASLDTLHAALPMIYDQPLLILIAARSDGDTNWQRLAEAAQRAIPERAARVTLPANYGNLETPHPISLSERRILDCASVLGERFPILALWVMGGLPDFTHHLLHLTMSGVIAPTDEIGVWQFEQSTDCDLIYHRLPPEYAALLHWQAYHVLQGLGLPTIDHTYRSQVSAIARETTAQAAATARQLDAPQEALVLYDRALQHASPEQQVDLLLARTEALMSLGHWQAAQESLLPLRERYDLTPRQRARVLIYRGELNRWIGEVGVLFDYYEEAAEILRTQPPSPEIQQDQVNLLHAQALARFRRGELEIARSIVGGALLQAERAALRAETARLWSLLASIHRVRGENRLAIRSIQQAVNLQRMTGDKWLLMSPLELHGNLLASTGNIPEARKYLQETLDLAQAVGDIDSIIRLRGRLGQLAGYRGHFDEMIRQYEAELVMARFSADPFMVVRSHVELSEALAMKGEMMAAFSHANSAIHQASARRGSAALAHLALARVALAARWMDDAQRALEEVKKLMRMSQDIPLRQQVLLTQMEVALEKGDRTKFADLLRSARDLAALAPDSMLRGRLAMLISRFKAGSKEWNTAVHEAERAHTIFKELGATYWQKQARALLNHFAVQAPDYVSRAQVRGHIRGQTSEVVIPPG